MKIHNIRLGHACNSSSTHSILFLSDWCKKPRERLQRDTGFGWDNFVLTSKESKANYLAAQLAQPFISSFGSTFAKILIKNLTGVDIELTNHPYIESSHYVDHQSQLAFPHEFNGKTYNAEFIQEVEKFLQHEKIVVYGGNDNSESSEYHPGEGTFFNKIRDKDHSCIARKDPLGYWLLYDRKSGNKIRLSFDTDDISDDVFNRPNNTPTKYKHSTVPELVDLKITNACSKGCAFCYQNSTKDGKHADLSKIRGWMYDFSRFEIPEVALGGGEPTQHPEFIEIIKGFRYYNVVPNFTTATLEWMKNKEMLKEVKENCGSFAYSVHSVADMQKFLRYIKRYEVNHANHSWISGVRANVQVVLGVVSMDSLFKIASMCRKNGVSLTILGYKACGRGEDFINKPYENWIDQMSLAGCERFGIDTVVAKEYPDMKHHAYLYNQTITETEGAFSMYIDAVENRFGASSYGETESLEGVRNLFEEHYPKFFKESDVEED